MSYEIEGNVQVAEFKPLVGLRSIGNFVKGTVKEQGVTKNGNPVITLELIDLDGSTSRSVAKGQYVEVPVKAGDLVSLVATVKDLKEKLPKIPMESVVTIKFMEEIKVPKGKLKKFSVKVD